MTARACWRSSCATKSLRCWSFGNKKVLRGVDLYVESGQVACLLGPSGSGKSTLLRTINHLERIDSGRITVGGEIVGYSPDSRGRLRERSTKEIAFQRRSIGMVFQQGAGKRWG